MAKGAGWEKFLNMITPIVDTYLGGQITSTIAKNWRTEDEYLGEVRKIFNNTRTLKELLGKPDLNQRVISTEYLTKLQNQLNSLWSTGMIGAPNVQNLIRQKRKELVSKFEAEQKRTEQLQEAENKRLQGQQELANDIDTIINQYQTEALTQLDLDESRKGVVTRARGSKSKISPKTTSPDDSQNTVNYLQYYKSYLNNDY